MVSVAGLTSQLTGWIGGHGVYTLLTPAGSVLWCFFASTAAAAPAHRRRARAL